MSTPQVTQPNADVHALLDLTLDAVEEDSDALHRITNMVKLLAFASEARRVLNGIDNTLVHLGKTRQVIRNAVPSADEWAEMEDVSSEVLRDVGRQLDGLMTVINRRPAVLRKRFGGAGHE